jgi:tetratricopeptide (TPR) repeat protein
MQDTSFEHFNLGVVYFKRGEYSKAIDEYELALKSRGNDYHIYNSIGVAYMELGEYSKALEAFNTSLKIKPNTDALNQVAVIYIYKQDFTHARKVLAKALQIEPDDSEVLMYMGIVEMFEENYQEAIEFLEHSLKTQPRLSHLNSINYNLGISYFKIEEFRTARDYFQKVPPGFEARDEYLDAIDKATN